MILLHFAELGVLNFTGVGLMLFMLRICLSLGLGLLTVSVQADYTKVANDGSALPKTVQLGTAAKSWACTYDSKSKLIWEIKTEDRVLRDVHWNYSWYASSANAGNAGTANGGNCADASNCDSEKFVQQVNKAGLCGAKDWRLPTSAELQTLIDTSFTPAIDANFFPDLNTSLTGIQGFWSSSSVTASPAQAAFVSFEQATTLTDAKSALHRIRLVRDASKFSPTVSASVTPASNISDVWLDQLSNNTKGKSSAIVYAKTPTGLGARFTQAQQSRIDYALDDMPSSGTIELLVRINSAYRSDASSDENCALLFATPRARLLGCKTGQVIMGVFSGNGTTLQTLSAKESRFRFGQWHLLSFSYGPKDSRALAVDGRELTTVVNASSTDLTLAKSGGILGDFVTTLNGKQVHIGFEGMVDAVRVSPVERDWALGKDRPKLSIKLAANSFKKPNANAAQAIAVLANDVRQRHVFGRPSSENWFEFFAKKGRRYTLEIPNDTVGSALNPGIEIYNASGQRQRSLVNDGTTGEGEQLIWTAPETAIYSVRVTNQPPFTRDSSLDNMFDIQIYDTNAPQQGLVKGSVKNACTLSGINKAEVAGVLGEGVSDSTLTHKTGEFGLLLNPDSYQIKSYASNYLDVAKAVLVDQEDDVELQLEQTPVANCAGYVAPPVDPVVLEQQAVSVFDPEQNILVVRDIVVGNQIFYAELTHLGDYRFQLYRGVEISSSYHSQPAIYDASNLIADFPTLFSGNKSYKVQLQNDGTGIFTLKSVSAN